MIYHIYCMEINCNVISLKFNNTNVVAYATLLTVFTSLHLMYECKIYALYYIYIYSGDMLRVWTMLTASIDLVGQSFVHVLNIYILCKHYT